MVAYKFNTKPYRHQSQALKRLLRQDFGGALLMEPRTGKSKTTIDYISALNQLGRIDRVVIICPNRIIGTWVQEFHIHCPRIFNITVWDAEGRKTPPPPVKGTYQLEVVLVNYEAFATPGKKTKSGRQSRASGRMKHKSLLLKWIGKGTTAMCVVDESHKIKSPSGKASNMIVGLGPHFNKRLILTGTPLTKAKRAHDIWMQWKFLNPDRFADLPTLGDFKAHFGRWKDVPVSNQPGARTFPKYVGPKNMKELQQRMGEDAIVVLREDCFDLPPREDIVVSVDLKGSKSAYEQMAAQMIALLEDGDEASASIRLVQTLRLSQITSGFVTTDEGEIKRVGFEKHDALHEIMEDLYEKDQKIVVAARWKPDLDLIQAMGVELGFKTFAIRGKVKRADSDKAILDFRDYDGAALMVIQPAAASMGIDLSTASTMVWYSHVNSWVDFTQACDRIALSRSSTTFIHLVARNSVDEIIMSTLANDTDVAKELMLHPERLLQGKNLNLDASGRISVKTAPRKKR
jgi:SNF2 family DNA or RNA helicase